MWEELLKAFSLVYLPSMIKFIFGPIAGKAAGLNLVTTMIATFAGMMTVVVAFTYFGEYIRLLVVRFYKAHSNRPERPARKYSGLVKKYGLAGIAALTPVILTPIGGTLIAVSISSQREKILFYMLISAMAWSAVLTVAVYFGYDAVMHWINQVQPV